MAKKVKRVRFDLAPGGCTNCGNVHGPESSIRGSPFYCYSGLSNRPGGDGESTCTHWGRCKPWCLGICYLPTGTGTFYCACIYKDDEVIGEEPHREGPWYLERDMAINPSPPKGGCRCPITDLMTLGIGHKKDCPEKTKEF